jgi:hypothetical protein
LRRRRADRTPEGWLRFAFCDPKPGKPVLADQTRIEADVVIAATGYTPELEQLVGHLDMLDERGLPPVHGGEAAASGLRFIGYLPRPGQIGHMSREAQRAAKAIKNET